MDWYQLATAMPISMISIHHIITRPVYVRNKTRQFIARLEKDFPGQSHQVRNDMVLLLVMAGNDYLKVCALRSVG